MATSLSAAQPRDRANDARHRRAHGATGDVRSRERGRSRTDEHRPAVAAGRDMISRSRPGTRRRAGTATRLRRASRSARFCSADPRRPNRRVYDWHSGLGYDGRLFLDGEEVGTRGPRVRRTPKTASSCGARLARQVLVRERASRTRPTGAARPSSSARDDTTRSARCTCYVGEKKATGNPARTRRPRPGARSTGSRWPDAAVEPTEHGHSVGHSVHRGQSGQRRRTRRAPSSQADSVAAGRDRVVPARRTRPGIRRRPTDLYFAITASFTRSEPALPAPLQGLRRTRRRAARSTSCVDGPETGGTSERFAHARQHQRSTTDGRA